MSEGSPVGRTDGPVPSALAARLRAAGCVFAEDEAALLLAAASGPGLERLVTRRVAGEPLEHVLGWAEFCGLRIAVTPGVFVPRRRTALLVAEAVRRVGPVSVLVDLCCGSGAVAAAVLAQRPGLEVHAADSDPIAVACARRNLPSSAGVWRGDLFDALPERLRGAVDVVAANAPYVPTDAIEMMPREARLHEPRPTLDGGDDGVAFHRRIAAAAREWLRPGGWLLVETGRSLAPLTEEALARAGLAAEAVTDDDLDGTVVAGRRPIGAP